MQFTRKNANGDTNDFDVSSYAITLFRDPLKPHKCNLTVPKNVPIRMFDIITIESDGGYIPFRGYVTNMSIPTNRVGTKSIECESIETSLNHRYFPVQNWQKTHAIEHMLRSEPPASDGDALPLIWWAQSYIPETSHEFYKNKTGTGYPYGNPNITVIKGAGKNSRIGTKDIWIWRYKADEYDSLADWPKFGVGPVITRFDEDIWATYYGNLLGTGICKGTLAQNCGLAADMAFDVGVRVRDLDNPDDAIGFHLTTNHDPAWKTIINFATKLGLNTHIWYDRDGLTYLDFLESSGRGESEGIITLYEEDINVDPLSPSLKQVSALIGLGMGDKKSRQITAQYDLNYNGVWIEELLEIPNGVAGGIQDTAEVVGNMQDYIDDQYEARNADLGFRLKLDPTTIIPWPTDSIGIIDLNGTKQVYEVKRIHYSSDHPFVEVDVGLTPDDLYDAFQAAGSLATVGGELPYVSQDPYTDSQDMTFGDKDTACSPATFTMSFDTGSGYFDTCRMMLSFSYALPPCMEFPFGSNQSVNALGVVWAEINGSRHCCYIGGGDSILGEGISLADATERLKLDGTTETIKFYVVWNGYFTKTPPAVSVSMSITPVWVE